MSPERVVLDISSDEEDGDNSFDYQSSTLEWIAKMLELEDEPWPSEDVVVVDELSCATPAQKSNSTQYNGERRASADDSDDDCKVLDGDPDKPVEVIQNEGSGSDDLLIVGEKGQLACRDYPHSRHLCATFPFSTTSHEKFCKLCHCYVCDIPAPCIYWATGSSTDNHCHSSDKEERWRQLRKASKHVNNPVENSERLPGATISIRPRGIGPPGVRTPGIRISRGNLPQTVSSCSTGVRTPAIRISRGNLPQTVSSCSTNIGPRSGPRTSVSIHTGSRSAPAQNSGSMNVAPTSVPLQNSVSRLHPFRRCSATSFGIPNIISQRRNHLSGVVHNGKRYASQLSRSQNLSGTNSIQGVWRDVPLVASARTTGRMTGAGFVNVTAKRPKMTNTDQIHVYSSNLQRSSCLPPSQVDENIIRWEDVLHGRDPNIETNFQQCTVYPQPEVYSQPCIEIQPRKDTRVDLPSNSAPAASNPELLGSRYDTSVNATAHAPLAKSSLSSVQTINNHTVPESNPVSGELPLGEEIASLGQERPQEAGGDQGLVELNPCTYDEEEIWDDLWSL